MLLSHTRYSYLCVYKQRTLIALITFTLFFTTNCFAKQYNFIVQPIFKPEKIRQIYQPLVTYLNQETGHTFNLITSKSFLSYWAKMKKGNYDLILDAAHFTDYRIKKMHYTVLVKIPETVSYSLITNENEFVLDNNEFIGKHLVTLPPPSLGSVRLAKMFPNQMRQPIISSNNSALDAILKVKSGKYFAALVPTPLLSQHNDVNTIATTIPVPHMAISASPKMDKTLQSKVQQALINASKNAKGKIMLKKLNISAFLYTNKSVYDGYEKLLSEIWGY